MYSRHPTRLLLETLENHSVPSTPLLDLSMLGCQVYDTVQPAACVRTFAAVDFMLAPSSASTTDNATPQRPTELDPAALNPPTAEMGKCGQALGSPEHTDCFARALQQLNFSQIGSLVHALFADTLCTVDLDGNGLSPRRP